MRATREAASDPRVAVYVSSTSSALAEIVVENFGEGTAAEVLCRFDPPLQSTMDGASVKFFDTPKWLPPRSRLNHAFDTWPKYLGSALPRSYRVRVTYKDVTRSRSFEHEYMLYLSAFEHMMKWERKDLHDLVGVTDSIKSSLDRRLGDLDRREAQRDNRWDAEPDLRTSDEAVASILAVWRLRTAAEAAPKVRLFDKPLLRVMRRAAVSGMAAAIREGLSDEKQQMLTALFVAVHNHDFDVMTSQEPAADAVAKAVETLSKEWTFSKATARSHAPSNHPASTTLVEKEVTERLTSD
jgi:hypothetical protein